MNGGTAGKNPPTQRVRPDCVIILEAEIGYTFLTSKISSDHRPRKPIVVGWTMMREYKARHRQPGNQIALLLRLQGLSDPSISDYIAKTRAKYGKYSMPIEEVRKLVDESMGENSLTDILFEMREAEPR